MSCNKCPNNSTEKVLFKNDVHSVCLPEATQIFPPGEGVVVTGWGALSYDGKLSFEQELNIQGTKEKEKKMIQGQNERIIQPWRPSTSRKLFEEGAYEVMTLQILDLEHSKETNLVEETP